MAFLFKKVLFTEDFFSVSLPDDWYQVSKTPGYYQYRSKDENANLSISIFTSNPPIKASEKSQFLDKFIDLSVTNLLKFAKDTIQLSDITKDYKSYIGSFWGLEPNAGHSSYFIITITSRLAAVYHYEALDTTQALFMNQAKKVLHNIKLNKLAYLEPYLS